MNLGMSRGEIIFLLMIVGLIFGWAGVPRLGARIGGLFDRRGSGARERER